MANLNVKDGGGSSKYVKADGAGTDLDPHVTHVVVDTLPALGTGSSNIGDVDIASLPADPFGANADAAVAAGAAGSIQAKLRRLTTDLDALKSLIPSALTALGNLKVSIQEGSATLTVGGVSGDVASDATDSGNPVKVGGRAVDPASLPADLHAGDRANILTDLKGRLLVAPGLSVDTEMPAAAGLTDSAANPTTPMVGSPLLGFNGALWDRVRVPVKFVDLNGIAIGSIATVWTPASGKKIRLLGGIISVSAAANVLFENNAAGAGAFVCRTPKLAADTPYNFDLGNGVLLNPADNVLKATSSAAANVTGTLYGTEE